MIDINELNTDEKLQLLAALDAAIFSQAENVMEIWMDEIHDIQEGSLNKYEFDAENNAIDLWWDSGHHEPDITHVRLTVDAFIYPLKKIKEILQWRQDEMKLRDQQKLEERRESLLEELKEVNRRLGK